MGDNMYEIPIKSIPNTSDCDSKKLKKIVTLLIILIVLIVVVACIAIAALVLSLSKSNSEDKGDSESRNSTSMNVQQQNDQIAVKNTLFSVTIDVTQMALSGGQVVLWDKVLYDLGNNYDVVTGAYTAPYDGYYLFSVTKSNNKSYDAHMNVAVEGVNQRMCYAGRDNVRTNAQFSCTFTLKLSKNQRVQIKNWYDTSVGGFQTGRGLYSWFEGFLIQSY